MINSREGLKRIAIALTLLFWAIAVSFTIKPVVTSYNDARVTVDLPLPPAPVGEHYCTPAESEIIGDNMINGVWPRNPSVAIKPDPKCLGSGLPQKDVTTVSDRVVSALGMLFEKLMKPGLIYLSACLMTLIGFWVWRGFKPHSSI